MEVEKKLTTLESYNALMSSILNNLKDKKWAEKIAKEAIQKLKNTDNIFDFAGGAFEMLTLANFLAGEDGLNDKESAKEIFDMVKMYDSITDLLDGARAVKEIYKDTEYAISYSQAILDKALESIQEGYYCDVYYFIRDELEDESRASEFKDKYEDEMRNDYQEYGSCEELFGDESSEDTDNIDFENYDEGEMLIRIDASFIGSRLDDMGYGEEDIPEEGHKLAQELMEEFTDAVKEKFDYNIGEKILLLNPDDTFIDLDEELDKFKYFDETCHIFMVITKDIPLDDLNALFLSLDEYEFLVDMPNSDGDIIHQGYSYGDYETGFFSNGEEDYYINFNGQSWAKDNYERAKKILIEHK